MWSYLRSLVTPEQVTQPDYSPVTINGIRFPADGSKPHIVSLTTHVVSDGGPDCCWGHVPDLRAFWKPRRAWAWRDIETFRLENQPFADCNGLYVIYFSFDLESLPLNRNFPTGLTRRERAFAGDAFVVKLKGTQIGEELDEGGWAAWIDVPLDIMNLPAMKI